MTQWWWTSASPRQYREKEPESKSRSQTNRSPVCFGISAVDATLQSVRCVCLHAIFRKYYSRLLSFFSLGEEGYTLPFLRPGGATHFFRVTGNLSATLERGRWLSVSFGRMYITEGLSVLAHRRIGPATAAALSIAAEALPGGVRRRVPPLAARGVRGRGSSGARAPRLAAQEQRTLETNGRQKSSANTQLHHPLPT